MAIVDMSVFTLISPVTKREELLKELQKFEYVHFRDMRELEEELHVSRDAAREAQLDEGRNHVLFLLGELKGYDTRPKGMKASLVARPRFSLDDLERRKQATDEKELYEKVKALSGAMDEINKRIHGAEAEQDILEPWQELESKLSHFQETRTTKVVLGSLPRRFEESFMKALLDYPDVYFKRVSEHGGHIYGYILYLKERKDSVEDLLRSYGFTQQEIPGEETPKEEKKRLELLLEDLRKKRDEKKEQFRILALELDKIEVLYEYYENQKLIHRATDHFVGTTHVDIISGYVPTKRIPELERTLQGCLDQEYYLEHEAADPEGDVPILLENNPVTDTFSGITSMYAMPRYNEIDPTPFLAPFYWLFFGMMGADVGYGLLLFLLSAVVLKMVPLQEEQKKFLKFFFYLSISLTIWGFIYGSCFGGPIPLPGLIDTSKDFTTLLILSISMGLVHLFFGLGIKAYMLIRDKKYMDVVYDVLFWYMAIAGGIVLLLAISLDLGDSVKTLSKWIMGIGMVGIVLFAGRASESIGGRLGTGVYELYGISSYVGDFVSYSRLMALGLSGGFIALSINIIVGIVFDKGIIGIIAGVIIFVIFHLFNIFLSMLSAYVHTSRLTYVEFFGKFYEGGGTPFKRFKTHPKYIDIKNTQGGKL